MAEIFFDLQRFAAQISDGKVTIPAGENFTLGGIKYEAGTSDAVLTAETNNSDGNFTATAITGIESGSVTATIDGKTDSPNIRFDGTNAFDFKCTASGDAINVLYKKSSLKYSAGNITYSAESLTFPEGTVKFNVAIVGLDLGYIDMTVPPSGAVLNFNDAFANFHTEDTLKGTLTFDENLNLLLDTLKPLLAPLLKLSDDAANKVVSIVKKIANSKTTVELTGDVGYNTEAKTLSLAKDTNVAINITDYAIDLTALNGTVDGVGVHYTKSDDAISAGIKLSPSTDPDAELQASIAVKGTTVFNGTINVENGGLELDIVNEKLLIGADTVIDIENETGTGAQENLLAVAADNVIDIGNGYDVKITIPDDTEVSVVADADGNIVYSGENFKMTLEFSRDGTQIFSVDMKISGDFLINNDTKYIGIKEGTTISVAFKDYTLTATATGDAASSIALTADGILITPTPGDGSLDITLTGTSSGSLSANIEVISGSFILRDGGALTVAKDTELKIDFGDGYIVNFKATADAGGSISLGSDGITFVPGSDDGGLELSVTRDGETRTASLDVTGSVTYKLDGSISLAKGTVVKNIFEDGNILTITANTDASGSIIFAPNNGLTITPSTPDALNVRLTNGDLEVVNISSIYGTINYTGGIITASDGTKIFVTDHEGYYTALSTEGGTTSVQFGTERAIYTVNDEANLILDYLDGTTWSLNDGTLTDIYNGAAILSEGATFTTNDYEVTFTLDGAGNYNLNGMNVTTTEDNVEVKLIDYDTIIIDGVSYSAQDDAAHIIIGSDGKISGVAAGIVQATVAGAEESPTVTFDATDGAIDFSASGDGEILSVKTRPTIEYISGEFTYKGNQIISSADSVMRFVSKFDDYSFTNTVYVETGLTYSFYPNYMTNNNGRGRNVYTWSNGTETRQIEMVGEGSVIRYFAERGFTLREGSSEAINIGGDYTVTATAVNGDAGVNLEFSANGLSVLPNSNDGALNVVLTRGDTEIISGELECTSGEIIFGYDKAVTFTAGTNFDFTQGDYVFTVNTTDEATTDIALTDTGLSFTPHDGDGALNLVITRSGTPVFGGALNVTDGTISFNSTTQKFSFTEGTNVSIAIPGSNPQQFDFKVVNGDASIKVEADGAGNFEITPDENDGSLDITFKQNGQTAFYNNISVSGGSIVIGNMGQIIGLTAGTTANVTLGNYVLSATTTDDASFKLGIASDGNISITPQENDGALDIVINRGDTPIFANTVNIDGTIRFNPATQAATLEDGTTINLRFGDYELTATASGDSTTAISFMSNGIAFTPTVGDGSLDITLTGTSGSSLSANIKVLSGSFILGEGGNLSVAKDTELQIDFGNDYIVNLKATDDAGGAISLSADGITFVPGSDDGGLELSVTRDGVTRTASLDVTGSVTYKLDGSISLTEGTVVKNIFKDGNILTITANTDAGGSMIFAPNNGLTITPSTPDALTVSLTTGDLEVVNISSIDGTINYTGGIVTASDGTKAHISYYFGWESELRTTGGSASIEFTADRTIYTAGEGATFAVDYLDGTTTEIQKGSYADVYGENIEDYVELVSEGTTLRSNDETVVFTLEKAGNYNLNGIDVTTTEDNVQVLLADYNTVTLTQGAEIKFATTLSGSPLDVTAAALEGQASVTVDDDDNITYDATDATLQVTIGLNEIIGESILPNVFTISGGSVTMGATDASGLKSISITAGTELSFTQNGMTFTGVVQNDINGRLWMRDNSVLYLHSYDEANFDTTILSNGQTIFNGMVTIEGAFSYSAERGTVGAVDSNTYNVHDSSIKFAVGNQNLKLTTKGDTFFAVLSTDESGKITFAFNNEKYSSFLLTANTGGKDVFEAAVTVNGSFIVDPAAQEITLTEGSTINIDSNLGDFSITALDDAGGNLSFIESGIRFAPNASDGALEIKFADTGRKVNLDISGAVIFNNDGKFSFEDGTEINLAWEDGVNLKLISHGSTGSIVLGENGIQITSDDENLDLELSTPYGYSTKVSGLKGSLLYNAGKVILNEGTKLTGTGTLGEQVVNVTVETQGGDAYLDFSASDGFVYGAGTGALKVTYARGDLESTFIVNSGSVLIGKNILTIAEGTDLSTDLKNFMPALYFTTTDAGSYTINGQKITTSTENISMTATDDRVTFNPGDAIIEYDEMYFTGDGNVSLTQDGVILGAGIEATGFGEKNTFILTEKGTVTADGKIFELVEDIPDGISVKGAQDGFSFSSTVTEESEERNGVQNSPNIGKIFTEYFTSTDNTYRVQAEIRGLQKVIGISDGATINGGMEFDGVNTAQSLYIVTESEGTFTVGEKNYTIGGDSEVTIKAYFDETDSGTAIGFDGLNGTVSGDFTEYAVTINGGESIVVRGDTDIAISANDNGLEIFGVSDGATLETFGGVSKAHTDGGGEFILGVTTDESIKIATYTDATFDFDDEGYLVAINGTDLDIEGELSYVDVLGNVLFVYEMQNGWIKTDAPKKVWVQMTGESMTLNDNELTLAEDTDGIWIRDKEIVGLDENASLTVGEAGVYTTSVTTLDAEAGDVIVGLGNDDAYIYDENNPLVTKKSTTEEIIDIFKPNETYVIGSESRGKFDVTLNGGDLAVVEDTAAFVNITAGDDTVVSKGNRVNVNLTDGNTWLFPLEGKMTLENYDHSTGSGFGTNYSNIENAIYSGAINFNKGILTLGSAQIDMGENNLLMNFFDRDGDLQKVGYSSQFDELDASKETADLLLFAENYSTIRGGKGDDKVFGNAGDFIDVGAGDNHIELKRAEERYEHDQGATINIVNGDNTIANFQTGFNFESDLIKNNSKYWDQTFDGKNVTIKTDGGTTILEAVGKGGAAVSFKEATNDYTYNVTLIQEDSVAAVDEIADAYYGENSGIDFTGYDGTLFVDLDSERGTAENSDVYFYGINKLTAGGGVTSLIGSAGDDILTAGNGRASIWGNWGNDLMIGNKSSDKMFATEFFFFAGDGRDTIENFNFGTNATADKINTGDCDINTAYLSGDDVVIELDDGAYLTIVDAAGKDFKIADMIAKVDTNVEFDGAANCYVATNNSATLTVNSDVESAEILLDGSGAAQFFGDIRTLDASNAIYATISGNALDNEIIGAEKHNTFNYMFGGGNDSIRNAHDGDVINLEFTLDEISSTEINSSGVALKFNDGGSLTVDGTSDVTYKFADGTTYGADHNAREWVAK